MTPFNKHIVTYPAGEFLAGRGGDETSQFGEDGLLAACLERFGCENKWCFEVGASDGLFLSNTHWMRCAGWNAVLIESNPDKFIELCVQRSDRVRCVHETIGPESLDRILDQSGAPVAIDVGVIDIDGQDYWAWDGMRWFRPRLMLVEFDYGSDDQPAVIPDLGGPGQASLKAIEQLGISKGYTPLAKTLVNLLFARTDILCKTSS